MGRRVIWKILQKISLGGKSQEKYFWRLRNAVLEKAGFDDWSLDNVFFNIFYPIIKIWVKWKTGLFSVVFTVGKPVPTEPESYQDPLIVMAQKAKVDTRNSGLPISNSPGLWKSGVGANLIYEIHPGRR